jgi:aminoglycoside phosphotransferase (APT) family kinase protein
VDGKRLVNTRSSSPFAQGRTAEIYAWEEGHVLKLYRDWCPADWVDYEARIAHAVHEAGIPSPKPGAVVEVDGRRGLVYERLQGISMVQDIKARPWMLWKHARSLAELQNQIHQRLIIGLPSYKDRLHYDLSQTTHLTEDLGRKALHLLEQLPDGQNICHGDYHPENVLITKGGPVVIDWMTACSGSPWADIARTSLILTVGVKAAGKHIPLFLRIMVGLYQRMYLQRYQSLRADTHDELRQWVPVIAAARLNENIIPEREALIRIVEQG